MIPAFPFLCYDFSNVMELDELLQREREKHEKYDALKKYISFGIGAILFTLLTSVLIAIIVWFIEPRIQTITTESHVVDLDNFSKLVEENPSTTIYDMRSEKDYSAGHIPGAELAKNDSCHTFGVDICTRRTNCTSKGPVFFYSTKGEDYHEVRRALSVSRASCWSDAYMLEGGFRAWNESSLPTE